MPQRMKLVVAYLGSGFAGWQRQPGQRTVQEELERAIGRALGLTATPCVIAAGRTDAGVHAAGQVVHVDVPTSTPVDGFVRGVVQRLPTDLRLGSATRVSSTFHARFDAVAKKYVYRLRLRPSAMPWNDLRAAAHRGRWDETMARSGLSLLPGIRDMASFSVTDPGVTDTIRRLDSATLVHGRYEIALHFVGGGFLRYQVRRMVGAVLELASGNRSLAWFRDLLEHPTPGARIRTAPARGLTLERVWYRRPAVSGRPTQHADGD